MQLTRPALLRALSALPLTALPPTAWSDEEEQVLPLSLCGGAYCVLFTIDKQPFRAIVDTGSPFLLVDGTPGPSPWGTYRGLGGDTGLEDTEVPEVVEVHEHTSPTAAGGLLRRGPFVVVLRHTDPPSFWSSPLLE